MSVKIYHNPRCGKSRAGLKAVEESGVEFEIIKYLDTKPSIEEIKSILDKLEMKPIELVRVKEAIWKETYKGKELTDEEIIGAMADNSKLIERPIVVKGDKAVLGRPTENIIEFLK
jgi:arsenate reductase